LSLKLLPRIFDLQFDLSGRSKAELAMNSSC
jgi:hypothetical protein